MWAHERDAARANAEETVRAQRLEKERAAREREYRSPVREPKPPKLLPHQKFKVGSQEWFKALPEPPSLEDQIAAGAICMRKMGQSVPKPKPPKKPGLFAWFFPWG